MLVFRDDHFSRKTKYSQPCFLSIFTLFSPNFTEFQRFFAKKKKNGGIPFLCKSPPTMPDHLNSLTYNIWTKAYSISFWFLVLKKTKQFHCQSHLWDLFKLWKLWRKSRLHWLSSQAVGQALDRNLVAVNGWLMASRVCHLLVRLLGICLGLRAVHMNIVGLNLAPASIVQNWPL